MDLDKKNSLIKELRESGDVTTLKRVNALVDFILEEARRQNDEAPVEQVLGNQGVIRGMKTLKSYLGMQ